MTIKEFEEHNRNHDMPEMTLRQGTGYKSEWDLSKPDDIIYIPEYAYSENEDGTISREDAFSARDFINLTNGDEKRAQDLFFFVDWQYPTSVLDERFLDEDEETE